MALSKTGKIYTWGFNGKFLLGRPRNQEEHLPLEVGSGDLIAKVPNLDDIMLRGGDF
jgi:alpha-tubulin suppressor-like RCC1 family protein